MTEPISIRKAREEDVPGIFQLIRALAEFEKAPEQVINTPEKMKLEIFGENPACRVLVAVKDEHIIGIAIYFFSYSTWKGRSLYLDDLYVDERFRRNQVGKMLFDALMKEALAEKVAKVHWQVLDWNTPAIRFYEKIKTEFDAGWLNCKLEGETISRYPFD